MRKHENGDLCIRSICGFEKYYKKKGLLEEDLLPGNWFRSGDIAHINEDNHIVIKGRINEYISRGISKILPSSIEDRIMTMHGIKDAIVLGVPDMRLYEEICVCFVTDPEHETYPTNVKEFCLEIFVSAHDAIDDRGQMSKYFLRFHSLPMLVNGQINRMQLRSDTIQQLELADQMDI